MLARAIPAMLAGPIAGVLLDRMDRKRVMIASDLVRAVVALGFILCIHARDNWMLYVFSALLMFASPFFTSGRSSHSAEHCEQGRAAYGELADADDAVDDADDRDICCGRIGDAIRLRVGVCVQCAVVSGFGILHLAVAGAGGLPGRSGRT